MSGLQSENAVNTAQGLSAATVALFLSVLLGLQPVLTDLFIPAMPAIQQEFRASNLLIQATMFGTIIAFGLGQMFWGVLSDRVGRKPALLWGLSLFVVSGFSSLLAHSVEALLLTRMIQGATLGAAVVCARAMVRDLYETGLGAQVLARGLTGLGAVAIVSPLLGGVLLDFWGWQANTVAIALSGLLALLMVWRRVPETIVSKDRQATQWQGIKVNHIEILSHQGFLAWSLVAMSTYGGLFVILSGGPFIFLNVLHLSATEFGMAIAVSSLSYLIGTLFCRRLLPKRGLLGTVQMGCNVSLVTTVWVVVMALFNVHSVAMVIVAHVLYSFAHGFYQPCSNAAAPGLFPKKAGTASSLVGLLMAVAAVGTGVYLALTLHAGIRPYALGLAFWSLLLILAGRWILPNRIRSQP